jgi:ribosome recycling factor
VGEIDVNQPKMQSLKVTSRRLSTIARALRARKNTPLPSLTVSPTINIPRFYSKDKGGKDKKHAPVKSKETKKTKSISQDPEVDENAEFDFDEWKNQGEDLMQNYKKEIGMLRSTRANPSLLEPITIQHQGTHLKLDQVAQITVKDAQTLIVIVHQDDLMTAVDKAIRSSSLGLNPRIEDRIIKVPVPK